MGSGDAVEEQNAETKARLDAAIDQEVDELAAEDEAALAALAEDVEETEEVELATDVDVLVKTHLCEEVEDRLERIEKNRDNLSAVRGDLVAVIAWFVEDEQYSKEVVWREYGSRYGLPALAGAFYTVAEPALDRAEKDKVVQKFREAR